MYGNDPNKKGVPSGSFPSQGQTRMWHNQAYSDDEQKLGEMDSQDSEYLDTDKVYNILAELRQEQRSSLSLKKVICVLTVFALLLALSNVGTSIAAARSAKDTEINSNGDFEDKTTGLRTGVTAKTSVYEVQHKPKSEGSLYEHEITKDMADSIFKELCNGWPGHLKYSGSDLSCGGGAASVDLHSCGYTTKVTRKSADPVLDDDNFLAFTYNANRGDFAYGDVSIRCDMSSRDAKCQVSGLHCMQECRLCGNSRPWNHWFCATEDLCSECTVGGCVVPGDAEFCEDGCRDPEQEFVS